MKCKQNKTKTKGLELQLLLAVIAVSSPHTTQLPFPRAGLEPSPEHCGTFCERKQVGAVVVTNSPTTHQFYSRIRSELDTDRRQILTMGGKSLKPSSFLLKCLFPRHCERHCCQQFSRAKHTDGNINISNTTPVTVSQRVSSPESLSSAEMTLLEFVWSLEGQSSFAFCNKYQE